MDVGAVAEPTKDRRDVADDIHVDRWIVCPPPHRDPLTACARRLDEALGADEVVRERAVKAVAGMPGRKHLAGWGRESLSAVQAHDLAAVDRHVECATDADVVERLAR